MSKYTTEVRFICESLAGLRESTDGTQVENVLNNCWDKIFDNFEIYEESHREDLCKKILRHYYTREIGLETYGLWKLKLNTKMKEIMPYYNGLYQSASFEYNPLDDVDITRTVYDARQKAKQSTGTENSSFSNSRNGSGENHVQDNGSRSETYKESDTPQGALTGLLNDEYMSLARVTNGTNGNQEDIANSFNEANSGSASGTSTESGTENEMGNLTEIIKGKRNGVSYSDLVNEYRKTIINIDMMIIEELKDLFFGLW